jgi:hypothetical protein
LVVRSAANSLWVDIEVVFHTAAECGDGFGARSNAICNSSDEKIATPPSSVWARHLARNAMPRALTANR